MISPPPTNTTTIHCSQLDLAWNCTESFQPVGLRVDPHNDMAELGSAAHDAARSVDSESSPDLDAIAKRYGVDHDELAMRWAMTLKIWPEVKNWFRGGEAETAMEHDGGAFKIVGVSDRVAIQGNAGFALDWNFGRLENPKDHQLRGYAFLLSRRHPEIEKVWTGAACVLLGYWFGTWYTRDELDAWYADLVKRITYGKGVFSPGHYCRFCPRQHDCPGAEAQRGTALALFRGESKLQWNEPPEVLGPSLAESLRLWRIIESHGKALREGARDYAAKHGGQFPTGDGKMFRLVPTEKRSVDARKAWSVLHNAGFSDDDMVGLVTLSVAQAEKIIAKRAGVGHGKAAIEQLRVELDGAGAITKTTTTQLKETKADE